jgi:hypothetical protein
MKGYLLAPTLHFTRSLREAGFARSDILSLTRALAELRSARHNAPAFGNTKPEQSAVGEIVERLMSNNARRAAALRGYQELRIYEVDYRAFRRDISIPGW